VEVEKASEVKFGERCFGGADAHLVNPIVETLNVLEVEQRLGKIEHPRGLCARPRSLA
jgi:hypothetical protein